MSYELRAASQGKGKGKDKDKDKEYSAAPGLSLGAFVGEPWR
ncbi:hypothetical protein [Halomonas huangheensis]|uniref:Uncharacterized protein n=1 Tax=Halomonas huangheensis TaxID=1178482 RepID=W1NDA9_9GAMM|nr:hypothetical protein [Halomonas huangheensis]ERL53356.1 hypothetical protein BJB45_21200 [Halomonas huangheensis]